MTQEKTLPPSQNVKALRDALQEQVDACNTDDCEMCHRHREVLAPASAAGSDNGG